MTTEYKGPFTKKSLTLLCNLELKMMALIFVIANFLSTYPVPLTFNLHYSRIC